MLQIPDIHTKRLLELADRIERLSIGEFDMSNWCKCIAGHCSKMYPNGRDNERDAARELLGITHEQADQLFSPPDHRDKREVMAYTRAQAARALRHLAVTGEVSWS